MGKRFVRVYEDIDTGLPSLFLTFLNVIMGIILLSTEYYIFGITLIVGAIVIWCLALFQRDYWYMEEK